MSTAVHGKASLAEILTADSAPAGKGGKDDSDKTNTVDFGATLMSLVDPTAVGKQSVDDDTAIAAAGPGKHGAKAATPTAFEMSRAEAHHSRFSEPATTRTITSESHTPERSREVGSHRSNARSDSFAALSAAPSHDPIAAIEPGKVAANAASPHGTSAKIDASKDIPSPASSDPVAAGDPPKQPVVDQSATSRTADLAIIAQPGVAAAKDAPVPDSDTALDFRKEPFSSKATDGAAAAAAEQITAAKNFAKVANPAHIDAKADIQTISTPRATAAAHAHAGRATDGTSPALSSETASPDSMHSADPKIAQLTIAKVAVDATASSAQPISPEAMDAVAQMAPAQQQRARATSAKDTSSQLSEASGTPNDPARGAAAAPVARTSEAAAIRPTPEVTPVREPSRTVSITVQLAGGQTAQANVRERAGAVDVKILTPTAASAQRVSSEVEGMRQNLDAAGIKLGHSEISYQRGDGGRQGHEGYRPPARQQSANEKEVFIMNEVLQ